MIKQAVQQHAWKRRLSFYHEYKPSQTINLFYGSTKIDIERKYKVSFYHDDTNKRNYHDIQSFHNVYRDRALGSTILILQFEARCYGLNFYYQNAIEYNETTISALSRICRTVADDYMKNF